MMAVRTAKPLEHDAEYTAALERARIVELLRKLSHDAKPSKIAGEAFSAWLELDAAADQIEAGDVA